MASQRLGQFYEGFASWRRSLAKAAPEAQLIIFNNAVVEVVGYVRKGLDRAVAADELADMAASIGIVDADLVQAVIAEQFARIERINGPDGGTPSAGEEDDAADAEMVPGDWSDYSAVDLNKAAEKFDRAWAASKANRQADILLVDPFPIATDSIPRRPWIVPGLLLRRQITLLIAPPGSGKSLLTVQIALMAAAAAQWAGWRPRCGSRVLIINSEEDGDELQRRLWAAATVMKLEQQALRGAVYYAEKAHDIVIAKADSRTKTVVRTPMIDSIVQTIKEKAIDILIVDPFAETFVGDENSNSELKWAAVLWREVARSTNCAVLLVHHAKKYAQQMAGDMDAARGGGSLAGVARIVCTLFAMSEEEAAELIDDSDERGKYLRFDDAKANLTLLTPAARWFFKQTVKLENGDDSEPADEVGVLIPWVPANVFDDMDLAQANAILDRIELGVIDDDGPTGDFFLHWKRGQKPKHWIGDIIQQTLACSEKQTKDVIKKWLKSKVIETFTAVTPQTKRHASDNNVRVVSRPGPISHEQL